MVENKFSYLGDFSLAQAWVVLIFMGVGLPLGVIAKVLVGAECEVFVARQPTEHLNHRGVLRYKTHMPH